MGSLENKYQRKLSQVSLKKAKVNNFIKPVLPLNKRFEIQ